MKTSSVRFEVVALSLGYLLVFQASSAVAVKCTSRLFRQNAEQCANQFFAEITTDATLDCRLPYQTLVNCINGEKENCLKMPATEWTKQVEITNQARRYIATEDYFCKQGMLGFLPAIQGCNETALYNTAVVKSFYDTFSNRRTSPGLCRLFSEAKKLMKKYLVEHCTPSIEVRQRISSYADPYNPYCSRGRTFLEVRFGHCTWRSYEKRVRKCTARFVRILNENGGKDCTSAFISYHSCKGAAIKSCQRGFYGSDEELNKVVNDSLARTRDVDRQHLCDGAMATPFPGPGQCKKEYNAEVQKCGAKMLLTYRANRTDPSLCWKYAKAKICATNVTKAMCSMTKDMKAYTEFYYDKFNPFSSNLHDPENETTDNATENPTVSQATIERPVLFGLVALMFLF